MKVMLVGAGAEQRAPLKSVLSELVEPALELIEAEPEAAANLPANPEASPDVTIVMVNGNQAMSFSILESQALRTPRPVLLAVLTTRSPNLMKQALRSGADEILFAPLDAGETTRALLKVSEARWKNERREGAVICSFMSMVGGVGVTSLAANVGFALQARGKRVVLVDLDFQTGGLAVFLNLDPEVSIMPLVRLDRKLDSIQLESALTKHESGMHLLAAPKRIEECELISVTTVGKVLDLMRQMFDVVIVDCGDHVDETVVATWERSDHLFYVLNQSIASARCAWRFVDLFERLVVASLKPEFVLNRYSASHPLGDKEIETTIAKSIICKIPSDDRTFEKIEMKAHDLFQTAPGSPLANAVVELANHLMPAGKTIAMPAPGLVSRLKSAFSPH